MAGESAKEKLLRERSQGKSKNKPSTSGSNTNNGYEAERKRIAATNPNKVVTPEQYAELEDLYAKAESTKDKNIVKQFQEKFHEYLPEAASQIISNNPARTQLARDKGYSGYDIRGNADGIFGDRTKQYMQELQKLKTTPASNVVTTGTRGVETPMDAASNIQLSQAPIQNAPIAKPKWWLQDVVKTAGAAGDSLRLKKYLPWAPKVSPYIPDPTFYDPTRELGQNTEAMNIGVQGAGAYGDPSQYGANFAAIQGAEAKNAADILGRYNNLNVGEANRYSGMRADIMNKSNAANANIAQDLYDKTTIANQNYDNSKAMARQELRSSFIDSITNRANAQVMNTMYPNHQIDPMSGGMLNFYKGDKPIAKTSQSQQESNYNAYKFYKDKGMSDAMIEKLLSSSSGQDNNQDPYRGYSGR